MKMLFLMRSCNVYTTGAGVLYQDLKHEAQPSVLGLDRTRIANFVNYLKNFTVYLSIFILIFSLQVILAKKNKSVVKFSRVCIRYRHSLAGGWAFVRTF